MLLLGTVLRKIKFAGIHAATRRSCYSEIFSALITLFFLVFLLLEIPFPVGSDYAKTLILPILSATSVHFRAAAIGLRHISAISELMYAVRYMAAMLNLIFYAYLAAIIFYEDCLYVTVLLLLLCALELSILFRLSVVLKKRKEK